MSIFKDVDTKKWYAPEIEKAVRYGLMHGKYDHNTKELFFDPEAPIKRGEMAALACRLYEATNEDFREIIDAIHPAVVQVENDATGGLGSGTLIHPNGYVLTNYHVVVVEQHGQADRFPSALGLRSMEDIFNGANYSEAFIVAHDKERDLALLKIWLSEGMFPYLEADHNPPGLATKVIAIGSPLGLTRTITEGIVSAIDRVRAGSPGRFIQTDAAINPGNSGGALVNLQGKLIGVPSAKYSSVGIEGLGFCIDIPTVVEFLREKKVPFEI